jgi:FAD/FMN-containing dehydrogenase
MTAKSYHPAIRSNARLTPEKEAHLEKLSTLVSPDEIISPSSDLYQEDTSTWSSSRNKHPHLVLRPTSVSSLSTMLKYLGETDLEFKARSQGFGNASAQDVVISLSAFNDFEWDEQDHTVILGAGGKWGDYYDKMDAVAPKWTSRSPSPFSLPST